MRKGTSTVVFVVLLSLMLSATSLAGAATGIAGRGLIGLTGGWEIVASGQLTPGGAQGRISVCHGCAGGPVFQVVPPSGTSDHWCIAAHRADAPGNNLMLYIRDVGDGKTTFDQAQFTSTFAPADCTSFPDPLGPWISIDKGNFVSH